MKPVVISRREYIKFRHLLANMRKPSQKVRMLEKPTRFIKTFEILHPRTKKRSRSWNRSSTSCAQQIA